MRCRAPSIADVSASPRRFGEALRSQACTVRLLVRPPRVRSLATRFSGAIMGEELIASLSDRLAATLRWWTVAAPEPAEPARRRIATGERAPERAAPSQRPIDSLGATLPPPRGFSDGHVLPAERKPAEQGTRLADQRAARWLHASGAEHEDAPRWDANGRASGGAELSHLQTTRMTPLEPRAWTRESPLTTALRHWESTTRVAGEGEALAPNATPALVRLPHAPATTGAALETARSNSNAAEPAIPVERGLDSGVTTTAPLTSGRERQWWSARVDAIHARFDGGIPSPLPSPNANEGSPPLDETAFADALGDVLRSQAKLYGVDVV